MKVISVHVFLKFSCVEIDTGMVSERSQSEKSSIGMSREDLVALAKLAQLAERYGDMSKYMYKVAFQLLSL